MYFVTGGAYNGKAKWVKKQVDLAEVQWISAYREESLPSQFHKDTVVLQGIEAWIKREATAQDAAAIRTQWQDIIGKWRIWEEENNHRRLILIGADITKGIVPIEVEHRIWRDATGWVFQDIVAASIRVDLIWYGVPQQLK